jgi:hypothetical protein
MHQVREANRLLGEKLRAVYHPTNPKLLDFGMTPQKALLPHHRKPKRSPAETAALRREHARLVRTKKKAERAHVDAERKARDEAKEPAHGPAARRDERREGAAGGATVGLPAETAPGLPHG